MKLRLLTFLFLVQCILLARTQFITDPDPEYTKTSLTTTSSTVNPSTPTSSTARPPTITSITVKPSTPTSSTAWPHTITYITVKPPTPTSSTPRHPTITFSTIKPPTTTSKLTTSSSRIPTTTQKQNISCPEKQSTFYKDDLNQLIDYVENEMKVGATLNESVYRNVKNIANDLMLELNTYLIQLEDQPNHIITTLNDIKKKREEDIVPLVKTANSTLNELLDKEHAKVAEIFAKMAQLLTEKYKAVQFCKYACDFSFRALPVKNNRGNINDDNYLCSTISEVLDKVKSWFFSFMEEQSKYIAESINNHAHKINDSIVELKNKLSKISKSILGVSMANVLHLQHDVIEAVQSIEKFNAQSYKYKFGLINANLSMLQVEFEKNILLYRKECVKCDSMAFRMDLSEKRLPKPNILDHLLSEKATGLEDVFHGTINSIFSSLYKKLNDGKLVENIVNKLQPLAKELALRTIKEQNDFTYVMQSAREKDRDRMAGLYNDTEVMLVNIIKENEKLEDMIHHLS